MTDTTTMPITLSDRIASVLRARPVIIQLLRFAAIGSLNTALDFIILNLLTKHFGIGVDDSARLWMITGFSFALAIVQSYIWNRSWAFGESSGVSVFENAARLVLVGGLGFLAFVAVFVGASKEAHSIYYVLVLSTFVVTEIIFWFAFKLRFEQHESAGQQFATFLIVSLIGLAINATITVVATKVLTPGLEAYVNPDIIKNIGKVLATSFSLIWNFVGFKILVFKR